MRKSRLFLLLSSALVSLISCGEGSEAVSPISPLFGTREFEGEEVRPTSHMKKLADESALQGKISRHEDFALLVIGRGHLACDCYVSFHKDALVPYQKATNALFYYLYADELSSSYGFSYGEELTSLALFDEGKAVFSETDQKEDGIFSSYANFEAWLSPRMKASRVQFVTREQASALYEGTQEFTLYFSRQSCADCLRLQSGAYKAWYEANPGAELSYCLDLDQVGIAKVLDGEGVAHSYAEEGECGERAKAQYRAFKDEYGLSYAEDNPAGYGEGYVPTLYHINPEGNGKKKGDVIDAAGVFYNDEIKDGTVVSSYFSEVRSQDVCLEYLAYAPSPASCLLEGKTMSQEEDEAKQNEILGLFLDWAVGNQA